MSEYLKKLREAKAKREEIITPPIKNEEEKAPSIEIESIVAKKKIKKKKPKKKRIKKAPIEELPEPFIVTIDSLRGLKFFITRIGDKTSNKSQLQRELKKLLLNPVKFGKFLSNIAYYFQSI